MSCWPDDPAALLASGVRRVTAFCEANAIPVPSVTVVERADWHFDVCAYYRPDIDDEATRRRKRLGWSTGIVVCLAKCATLAPEAECRNWSWPGNATDRTPVGVVAHELAHHLDYYSSTERKSFHGDYSVGVVARAGEKPITKYGDGPHEIFAEWARLYITNHALLRQLRPAVYAILRERWTPVGGDDWRATLGANVPGRILRSLANKGAG